jgi:isopentenyldiphosphate isomerase
LVYAHDSKSCSSRIEGSSPSLPTTVIFMNIDEYLDLVDADDNVIGKILRSEAYAKDLSNFRVVNAFVINSNGELWIPRRTANKRIFPLCLDMSAAGHVESGESYEESLKREVKEELNIDLDVVPFKLLGTLQPKDGVSAYMKVYEIRTDEAPDFNKDDFTEYFWLKPEDVIKRIESGDKSKDDLSKLVKAFYLQS